MDTRVAIALIVVLAGVAVAISFLVGVEPKVESGNQPWDFMKWALHSDHAYLNLETIEAADILPAERRQQVLTEATGGEMEGELAMRAFYVMAKAGENVIARVKACREENPDDWDVGEYAAYAAAEIDDVEALRLLLGLVHDEDETVRAAAAVSLRRWRDDRRAQEALKGLLNDDDDEVIAAAAGVLVGIGDADALVVAEEILEEDDEDYDAWFAEGIAWKGNDAALPWLDRLARREWEEQRVAAARAFGVLGTDAARSRLQELLKDEESAVPVAAGAALAKYWNDASAALILVEAVKNDIDLDVRAEALKALIGLNRPEDEELFRQIFETDEPQQGVLILRTWAAAALLSRE